MNSNNVHILDLQTMQGLLADYAFGRLGEEERAAFERSLPQYPEIEQELRDVREVFSRVERTEFIHHYERRSRNLPVSILKRIEKKSKGRRSLGFRTLPALGLIVAAIIMVTLNYSPQPPQPPTAQSSARLVMPKDADYVASQSTSDELAEAVSSLGSAVSLVQQDYDAILPALSDGNAADVVALISSPVNAGMLEENLISTLSDAEFSNLLENSDEDVSL